MFINQSKINKKSYFMKLALMQARKNLGNTNENPSVGCVLVKNNHVISAGSTSIKGRPHAEYNAIKYSNVNPIKSTLYVTLEPCSHFGKTPPCTNLIINNKIKKVFYSIPDPDLRSKNKCRKALRKKSITANEGLLKKDVKEFYKSYIMAKTNKFPYLTSKLAVSKDLYSISKKNKWITNQFSRGRVHLMRSNYDCILTSSKTIIKDNSKLTCRIEGLYKYSPSRIILDSRLKIPLHSNVIKDSTNLRTIIFYNFLNAKKLKLLKKLNVETYKIPLNKDKNLDLQRVLIKAKKLGFSRIFLETGIKLTSSFLKEELVDDLKLFVSSKKLGRNGYGSIKSFFNSFFTKKKKSYEKINLLGDKLINFNLK